MRGTFCFRTPFGTKRVHGSQRLLGPALQRFYPNFSIILHKATGKISSLVRSKILGLFDNTFFADRINCRHRWEKLLQQIETLLAQKQRTFFAIFIVFLESTQNFAHFERKDHLHSLNISEVIDP